MDARADPSLRCAHRYFFGFIMRGRLISNGPSHFKSTIPTLQVLRSQHSPVAHCAPGINLHVVALQHLVSHTYKQTPCRRFTHTYKQTPCRRFA